MHPVAEWLLRALLWLTTGQRRREWVAVHRKHHTFTDRPGDPHSPRLLGLWRVQLMNAYYYVREARNPDTLRRYAPDIAPDWWDRQLFARGWVGPAVGVGLLCSILGLLPIVGLVHAVLYVVVAPLINGLGHWGAGRPSPTARTTGGSSRG
jgi:stearoyl-CoA desaturase (Delta-9 desaturase)